MKLIISEKPSTAKIIAHAVGAREKIYGEGKEFCYKGNGFYVVNARGHLYGVGMPQDYGYSKSYKMDELPMFPEFELYPAGEDTENLRNLITHLINLPEVDELICATDAGREGELSNEEQIILGTAYLENGVTNVRLQSILELHSTEIGRVLASLVCPAAAAVYFSK